MQTLVPHNRPSNLSKKIIKKSLENTNGFAVGIWLQHIATVQTVVLHNQLSSPSHKIIKFLGNYHLFQCSQNIGATCCNNANAIIDSKYVHSQCKHQFLTADRQTFQRKSSKNHWKIPMVLQLGYGCSILQQCKQLFFTTSCQARHIKLSNSLEITKHSITQQLTIIWRNTWNILTAV